MQSVKYYKDIDFIKIFDLQHDETIFKPKPKEEWNKKAKHFDTLKDARYYEDFIKNIDLSGVQTVLDVGCGNGNLALKFLQKGIKVVGMDYSEGMLESFKKNTRGFGEVKAVQKAWEDDWSDVDVCDIAVVSKSFEFTGLSVQDAVKKLNSHAKKAVYMTYYVGNYLDDEILECLEKDIVNRPEYILLLNVLYQMGIEAKLDFITEEDSKKQIHNFNEFIKVVKWKLGELNENDIEKLKEYYQDKVLQKKPLIRNMKWAYIYWKKKL